MEKRTSVRSTKGKPPSRYGEWDSVSQVSKKSSKEAELELAARIRERELQAAEELVQLEAEAVEKRLELNRELVTKRLAADRAAQELELSEKGSTASSRRSRRDESARRLSHAGVGQGLTTEALVRHHQLLEKLKITSAESGRAGRAFSVVDAVDIQPTKPRQTPAGSLPPCLSAVDVERRSPQSWLPSKTRTVEVEAGRSDGLPSTVTHAQSIVIDGPVSSDSASGSQVHAGMSGDSAVQSNSFAPVAVANTSNNAQHRPGETVTVQSSFAPFTTTSLKPQLPQGPQYQTPANQKYHPAVTSQVQPSSYTVQQKVPSQLGQARVVSARGQSARPQPAARILQLLSTHRMYSSKVHQQLHRVSWLRSIVSQMDNVHIRHQLLTLMPGHTDPI